MTRILFLLGALFALAFPAHAQPVQALAVTTCGAVPVTITNGNPGPFTVDIHGNLCIGSSGGSGGGAVYGPTAAGSPAANPPVVVGGTVDGTATGNVAVATVKPASTPSVATDTSAVVQLNPDSPGIIGLGQAAKSASVPVTIASDQYADPCQSGVAKSSVPIAVATATTTSLVAVSGSTTVYVCGFSISIAPSATAADTALFEYGTSTNCTGTHALTGTYGDGDLTSAAPPIVVDYGNAGATIFKSAASAGVCIVTAGTAVSVQGVLTYVQQ